jgi:hypothetical protein
MYATDICLVWCRRVPQTCAESYNQFANRIDNCYKIQLITEVRTADTTEQDRTGWNDEVTSMNNDGLLTAARVVRVRQFGEQRLGLRAKEKTEAEAKAQ